MTDNEKFEAWWKDGDAVEDAWYKDDFQRCAFHFLAIGREEGRRERTVEIYEMMDECYLEDMIMDAYPECFECGCHQLGGIKCSSCDNSIPLPECSEKGEKK